MEQVRPERGGGGGLHSRRPRWSRLSTLSVTAEGHYSPSNPSTVHVLLVLLLLLLCLSASELCLRLAVAIDRRKRCLRAAEKRRTERGVVGRGERGGRGGTEGSVRGKKRRWRECTALRSTVQRHRLPGSGGEVSTHSPHQHPSVSQPDRTDPACEVVRGWGWGVGCVERESRSNETR